MIFLSYICAKCEIQVLDLPSFVAKGLRSGQAVGSPTVCRKPHDQYAYMCFDLDNTIESDRSIAVY